MRLDVEETEPPCSSTFPSDSAIRRALQALACLDFSCKARLIHVTTLSSSYVWGRRALCNPLSRNRAYYLLTEAAGTSGLRATVALVCRLNDRGLTGFHGAWMWTLWLCVPLLEACGRVCAGAGASSLSRCRFSFSSGLPPIQVPLQTQEEDAFSLIVADGRNFNPRS